MSFPGNSTRTSIPDFYSYCEVKGDAKRRLLSFLFKNTPPALRNLLIHCVYTGLIAARYMIRGRPIVVTLNYGGCLKCSPHRPLLEADRTSVCVDQTIAHAAFDESLPSANSYSLVDQPPAVSPVDLYTALGESNLRLIRSTFRRARGASRFAKWLEFLQLSNGRERYTRRSETRI